MLLQSIHPTTLPVPGQRRGFFMPKPTPDDRRGRLYLMNEIGKYEWRVFRLSHPQLVAGFFALEHIRHVMTKHGDSLGSR